MIDRIPLTEKKDYELVITNQDSSIIIRELSVIGFGGSCIVYKGKRHLSIEGDDKEPCTVVVKEFFPEGLDISRSDDMTLQIGDNALFFARKEHFCKGQLNHVKIYEHFQDQILPRPFFFGYANNTVYSVSDPWKGRPLSQINFETLKLKQIASIMESICSAIRKIHSKKKLYLDCKPDNFFYYGKKSDLQTKVYLFDFDTIISLKDVQCRKNVFCSASFDWIPPEQEIKSNPLTGVKEYRDPQQIGYHTDIYSVGAVFFWLLTKRNPTAEDINSILNHTFDWQKESVYCSGEEQEIIDIIQDITESSLQPNMEVRGKMFRHYISIDVVQEQYRNLYGMKAGDDVHFEPIHSAIKRFEEEFFAATNEIKEDVKKMSEQISSIQLDKEILDKSLKYLLRKNGVLTDDDNFEIENDDDKEKGKYEGETQNDIPSGTGVYYLSSGARYEGTFKDGKPFGRMTYYYGTNDFQIDRLEGEFDDFKLPSTGRIIYKNGDVYDGQLKKGIPQGTGIMAYVEGGKYSGSFNNGLRDGQGIQNLKNGDVFVGDFINNNWVKGSYCYCESTDIYKGSFDSGLKSGHGKLCYANGAYREGLFIEDRFSGHVVFTDSEGISHNEYYIDGNKAENEIFESLDINDSMFQVMKAEYALSLIKERGYTFVTKTLADMACKAIRNLLKNNEGRAILKKNAGRIKDELTLCLTEYPKEAVRSGDASLYAIKDEMTSIINAINDCKESTLGWGPERHMYDKSEFVPYPTINSKKDNPTLGDERAFIHFKRHGEESFNNDISEIVPEEKYDIRIYYNNDADESIGEQFGCASNVRLSTFFPVVLRKNSKGEIGGVISSSNSSPETVWAQRYVRTSFEKLYIHYVPGTAVLHNKGAIDGIRLSDELFTKEGTYIGKDALDGSIPGGSESSGYVDYTIQAEEISGEIRQTVSYDGINYQDTISVLSGSDIYFRIAIANIGDKALTNVTIKGFLSDGLQLVPGSVTLMANNSGKHDQLSDDYDKNGYNFGKVGTGNEICIFYKCSVNRDLKARDIIVSSALLVYDSEVKEGDRKDVTTIIRIGKGSISPWGPSRKTFTNANPAPYVTFNSITDNAGVGDERNFVRICEANANDKYTDEVKVKNGKVYEVYIYYQNDASPSLCNIDKGIAQDVRVRSLFPPIVTAEKKHIVKAEISSLNSSPTSVWAGAYITSDEELELEYVPNSLRLHTNTETDGQILNADEVFSKKGTFISTYFDKPGIITSKSGEDSGYITYCLSAKRVASNPQFNHSTDDRVVFIEGKPADYAVFNSITDNPFYGDERDFVRVKEIGSNYPHTKEISVMPGKEYEIIIYYRNDANPITNQTGYGIATCACISSFFPEKIAVGEKCLAGGVISWNYVNPYDEQSRDAKISDVVRLIAKEDVVLRYKIASAVIHNSGKANDSILSTALFSEKGTAIGYNELKGVIPGGAEYSGYITYTLIVDRGERRPM